jgi:hypothetical protein
MSRDFLHVDVALGFAPLQVGACKFVCAVAASSIAQHHQRRYRHQSRSKHVVQIKWTAQKVCNKHGACGMLTVI